MGSDEQGIGQRVRAKREALGMTREELAFRSGLSFPTISRLEQGKHEPTFDTLRSLAKVLDVGVAELLGETSAA